MPNSENPHGEWWVSACPHEYRRGKEWEQEHMPSLGIEILGLPPEACSPNARVHWVVRHKATTDARLAAGWEAMVAKPDDWETPEKATVQFTFVVPDRRRRDSDNFVGRAKSFLDGLVDAGVIKDDSAECLTLLPPKFEVSKELSPRTRIRVEDLQR